MSLISEKNDLKKTALACSCTKAFKAFLLLSSEFIVPASFFSELIFYEEYFCFMFFMKVFNKF